MRFLLYTKQRQTLIAFAMMLSLSGCVKDKLDTGREGEVPLKLTLSIETVGEPDTKAPLMGPNFPAGTHNVGLVVSNTVSGTKPGYYNMLMSVTSDGKGNNTMKYFSGKDGKTEIKEITVDSKNGASVVAYYPRIEGLKNYTLIPFDLTTAAQKASQTDLLYAPFQTVTVDNAANVPLVFKHVYAMLEFQVTRKYNSAGVAGFRQISVNNKTGKTWVQNKGTMNAVTGGIVGTSAGSVAVDYADAVNKVEFGNYTTFRVMIPPFSGAYADDDVEIAFTGLGDAAPQKLLIKKKYLSSMTDGKYAMKAGARYVFKLSYDSSPHVQIEVLGWSISESPREYPFSERMTIKHGKYPHGLNVNNVPNSSKVSYNILWGENNPGSVSNGNTYTDFLRAFIDEPPFYDLEVADRDETDLRGDPLQTKWSEIRGSRPGDDYCTRVRGGTWRMPRLSEMYFIQLNISKRAVGENLIGSFNTLDGTYYTATEYDNSHFWSMTTASDPTPTLKTSTYGMLLRCVRESTAVPTIIECTRGAHYLTPEPVDVTITKTSYSGPALNSYNGYIGRVEEGRNGFYQIPNNKNFYEKERPYYKFEVDKNYLYYSGKLVEMSFVDAFALNDACRKLKGPQWRMPRISELQLIVLNRKTLEMEPGFVPISDVDRVLLSSSQSTNNGICVIHSTSNDVINDVIYDYDDRRDLAFIRCIREIHPEPSLMIYGGLNGLVPPEITRSLDETLSYNKFSGEVAGGANGQAYDAADKAFANEPPYPYLEIDKEPMFETSLKWTWSMKRDAARKGDICRYVRGAAWRMPRISELIMMRYNRLSLAATVKFCPLKTTMTSATETTTDNMFSCNMEVNATPPMQPKTLPAPVRCVREIRPEERR